MAGEEVSDGRKKTKWADREANFCSNLNLGQGCRASAWPGPVCGAKRAAAAAAVTISASDGNSAPPRPREVRIGWVFRTIGGPLGDCYCERSPLSHPSSDGKCENFGQERDVAPLFLLHVENTPPRWREWRAMVTEAGGMNAG